MKKTLIIFLWLIMILISACKEDEDSILKVDKTKLEQSFNAAGGNVSIPVNSNNAFEAHSSGSWCVVNIQGQAIKVSVDKLETNTDRTAQVLITSKDCAPVTVTVTQKAVWVDESTAKILIENGHTEFTLKFISGCPVTFILPDWIHQTEGNSWKWGENTFKFIADAYTGADVLRSGIITIKTENPANSTYSIPVEQTKYINEASLELYRLLQTSPLTITTDRRNLLAKMQDYADKLPPETFQTYLSSSEQTSLEMEKNNPILSCYRYAFDHVVDGVKNERVENGTVAIWLLYNMGIIVKTPSACFGVDVNHRWAEKLVPYLDFLCVSHDHADHKSAELMQAMYAAGKPILSNFYTASNKYYSKAPANYTVKNMSIRTAITDHNTELLDFITVFRIDCGDDSGNFSILHCGDSDFNSTKFTNVQGGTVSLLMLRNGANVENNIIGTGSGKVQSDNALLSHIIELRHQIVGSPVRFPVIETLGHTSRINCKNTYMPFWGEKFIWKNGKLE